MRTARTLFLSLLAIVYATASEAIVFPWPNSNTHPHVMLYADQSIENYLKDHPEWFKSDFIVGGLYLTDIDYGKSGQAMSTFVALYSKLFHKHIISGTYISGTTAMHELSLTQYPPNAVSIEDMSLKVRYLGPWIRDPSHFVVNLSDSQSRKELEGQIGDLWRHAHTIMRFVDNAAVHPRVARLQPWNVYCQNIAVLRSMAEALHGNAIFNVFVRPWEMSEEDNKQLISAVAGNGSNAISFPLPWSKSIKNDKNANGWAIYRYRQMLNHHVVVILIPSNDASQDDLYNWISTWKRPSDRLYIARSFWDE